MVAVVGVMDTDADAVVAGVGVAAVVAVVVVKGAGDEVSIGVGPFNCASDALSAAADVFWTESAKKKHKRNIEIIEVGAIAKKKDVSPGAFHQRMKVVNW